MQDFLEVRMDSNGARDGSSATDNYHCSRTQHLAGESHKISTTDSVVPFLKHLLEEDRWVRVKILVKAINFKL